RWMTRRRCFSSVSKAAWSFFRHSEPGRGERRLSSCVISMGIFCSSLELAAGIPEISDIHQPMKAHLLTIVVLITLMACGETPKPIPAANYTAFRAETAAVVNANRSPAADSVTEMVQAFYDWYVPLANNMSLHGA